jgi:hypothetical protein
MRKAVLVGTARNIEKYLIKEIPKLIEVLSHEFEIKVFIVESDSEDKTVERLSNLAKFTPDFDFVSLGNLTERIPDRVSRIRYCRNVYVNEIRNNSRYEDSDYVIVADLDGVNSKLKAIDLNKALDLKIGWDGLMANQSAPYYDLYALRHDQLMPRNFLVDIENSVGRKGRLKKELIWERMIKIDSKSDPILVKSAFGGLAIYKKWVFERFDYGDDNIPNECEHVYLNLNATESGAKLYIIPTLINSGWNEHNLSKYFITRNLLRLKRRASNFL